LAIAALGIGPHPADAGSKSFLPVPSEYRLLVRPKADVGMEAAPGASSSTLAPIPAGRIRSYSLRFKSSALDSLGRRFACKTIARLAPWDEREGTLVLRFPRGAFTEKALVDAYRASGRFDLVEADGIGFGHGAAGASAVEADPNDAYFNLQYGLRNPGARKFGTTQSKSGADIKAEDAWEINRGNTGILVAILDCGLNIAHPDIASRVWINKEEIPGNGKDDDGNGFIDDVNGWNYAIDANGEAVGGNPDVTDHLGHGTNVAGIVGAISGNGIGMAGVATCTLMPVKVLNDENWGYFSWWAAGIRYAVDNGARIINMSMGGPNGDVTVLRSAIAYAVQKNVTVVVSMGNSRSATPDYPAAYPGVIAVGATGPDDRYVRSFPWDTTKGSNYGSHISVCAPGNYIYGLHFSDKDNYGSYWSGTSQAAPHVTGVCALLLAQNPARTPADLKQLIEAGADDQVGDPAEDTPGFDVRYGHGRLNAQRSLAAGAATALVFKAERYPKRPFISGIRFGDRNLLGRILPIDPPLPPALRN
jgi:subtilisin family serine protease